MKVKPIIATMFVLGLVGGSALAAQQRGDIAGLRDDYYNQGSTSSSGNWLMDHVKVGAQLNVDASLSDKTRATFVNGNILTPRLGPSGYFIAAAYGNKGSSDITLNNSNVSLDFKPADWVRGHIELTGGDYSNSSFSIDEAYATLGKLQDNGFFLSAGREYAPYGYYGDPHPLTPSLMQSLSQVNATMVDVGFAQPCGFYGSGYLFRGVLKAPSMTGATVTNNNANVNNGGLDVGYNWNNNQMGFSLGAGWLYNISDVAAILPDLTRYSKNVGGLALHAEGFTGPFDANITYVGALSRYNTTDGIIPLVYQGSGAAPKAVGGQVGYGFNTMGHENRVALGYQQSYQASAIGLPQSRIEADWTVGLFTRTNLQFQYTYDKDYSVANGGTGTNANTGKVRLSVDVL